jgi:hypothetical protein
MKPKTEIIDLIKENWDDDLLNQYIDGLILVAKEQERQKAERLCLELEKKMDLHDNLLEKKKILELSVNDWNKFKKEIFGGEDG